MEDLADSTAGIVLREGHRLQEDVVLMFKVAALAVATLAVQAPLSGPPVAQQFEWAKAAFNRQMIDYPSARFRDVHADRRRICGWVNGKNRLGAYSGWKRFVIAGIPEGRLVIETDDDIGEINLMCDGDEAPPANHDYSARLAGNR